MTYDCAIVGGGPAGSIAAYRLAKAGLRVVLLEKARYPRPKACGSGLDAIFWASLPQELVIPCRAECTETSIYAFRVQAGRDWHLRNLPQPMALSSRERLDEWLARRAEQAGAEVLEGFRAESIRWHETHSGAILEGKGRRVDAEVVIAADGVHSFLARLLELGRPRSVYALTDWAVQVPDRVLGDYEGVGDIDLLALPEIGYGWVFPKADHLSVGVGALHRRANGLAARTVTYLEGKGLSGFPMTKQGHWLTFARPGARFYADRARTLAIGDAAGLADPGSGGGIGWAIWSAQLATDAVVAWFKEGKPLGSYQRAIEVTLMRQYRHAEALRNQILMQHVLGRGARTSWWDRSTAVITGGSLYTDVMRPGAGFALGRLFQNAVVTPFIEKPGAV